jgi:hypothetical protein
MSASAAACLDDSQRAMLHELDITPLVAAIPVIETLGGGSVRCMLAEVPGRLPGGAP